MGVALVGRTLLALVAIGGVLCTLGEELAHGPKRTVKKRVLLDQTPLLPDKVRLLAECHAAGGDPNCTRTCPQNYALDPHQRYCRSKRQGPDCPQGYVPRAGGGGCVLEDIQCPPGSTREGSRCVIRSYGCPTGYVPRGNSCVRESICQSGFRWENGFCIPAGARMYCPAGFTEQRNGNCAPSACADCCDCQDETVPTICPPGYGNHWGRGCVRLMQASPDLRIDSVVYRLPVECRTAGETFNEGRCESWSIVGRPACRSGHLYNGSCVEVARCQRGTLNQMCSCEFEQEVAPTCAVGKLNNHLAVSCIVSKVNCRSPGRLRNGVCVRESKARSTCPEGVPFGGDYCAIDVPKCPPGFALDEQGLCKKKVSPCRMDCGPYQKHERWCGLPAICPDRYTLNEHGYCVLETVQPAFSCPPGTVERAGRECVSESPLCRSNYRYQPEVNLCVRCDDQPIRCPRGNLTDDGKCRWSDPACPDGYRWSEGMCVRNDESRAYRCRKGYEFESLCVHGELACPSGHELYGESCVVKEDIHCPDGSYPHEGRCTVALECPEHFQAGPDVCVREKRRHINSTRLGCPSGFEYDGEACTSRTLVEPSVTQRDLQCPEGYERRREDECVRSIRTFAVCPPRTIYTEREDRCYCEVDLTCPPGYERSGADCIFRAIGYSSAVNFLNPCYGAFCGHLNCLSQCANPPCPFEHCSNPGLVSAPVPSARALYGPASCGQQDCPPQEIIGLVCPPGYERVNSSCFAYYDKRCPEGYTSNGDDSGAGCTRDLLTNPICPPGYTRAGRTCRLASCPNGFKLTGVAGTVCEKREFRSPKPCPPGMDFFRGACYRRSVCRNGTIDGDYCVEREFVRPSCPPGYVQRAEDCTIEGSCRADAIYIDGACLSFTEPAGCPDGTYQLGKLCVYPDPPKCEERPFVTTECTSEVDAQGRCWKSALPTCPKGYQLVGSRCLLCQTEPPNCPSSHRMTIERGEICTAERIVCHEGYFLRAGQCVKLHITQPRCPSEEYGLCDGFCIAPHVHECKKSEYHAPFCARGFQHRGKCVQLGRCDPEYTLLNGECHMRSFFDPSCHGKGTRVGELCVGGTPQCPPNYALMGGRCYSCLIEHAHCSGGNMCSDSFCHLDPPRCITSGAVFDGQVCRQLTVSAPSCPAGTRPDQDDDNFCRLATEKAVYNCPEGYHYQNGVCLRKLYQTPACPDGYKIRHGACTKRVCTRMSSGSTCTDSAPSTSAAVTCTQCLNGTVSSSSSNIQFNDDLSTSHGRSHDSSSIDLCCSVFSPRMCHTSGVCNHERETICGSFCFTEDDKIYLTVPHSSLIGTKLYMAPRRIDDDDEDDGDNKRTDDDYDIETTVLYHGKQSCFQCAHDPASCPKECNTYDCQASDEECHFIDVFTFCSQYRGGKICENMRGR